MFVAVLNEANFSVNRRLKIPAYDAFHGVGIAEEGRADDLVGSDDGRNRLIILPACRDGELGEMLGGVQHGKCDEDLVRSLLDDTWIAVDPHVIWTRQLCFGWNEIVRPLGRAVERIALALRGSVKIEDHLLGGSDGRDVLPRWRLLRVASNRVDFHGQLVQPLSIFFRDFLNTLPNAAMFAASLVIDLIAMPHLPRILTVTTCPFADATQYALAMRPLDCWLTD